MRFRAAERLLPTLLVGLACVSPAPAGSDVHFRDESGAEIPARVQLNERVADPVFAFLLGVLDEDLWGWVDQAYLDSLARAHDGSALPVELVRRIERRPGPVGTDSEVRLVFDEELKTPIPFSILGYNPGSIRATRELRLLHWRLPPQDLTLPGPDDSEVDVEIHGAHLFVFAEGGMRMDIDYVLDKLLGSRLDDVDLSGFLVFEEGEELVGLGFGYNGSGDGRTGAFDFRRNESVFPAPPRWLALGRLSRGLGESLLQTPDAPRRIVVPAKAPEGTVPR